MSRVDHAAAHASPTSPPREGFALPLAIMVLALMSIGLVAGFAMSTSEQAATSSQRAQARAYSYAQMGLEAFLTQRKEFRAGCTPATRKLRNPMMPAHKSGAACKSSKLAGSGNTKSRRATAYCA